MNIVILTAGSRGDIQPFVALGVEFMRVGHRVTLAAPALFESFVREYGVPFAPLDDAIIRLKDTSAGKASMEGKGGKLALYKQAKPMMRRLLDDAWNASQGADILIYHPKTLGGGHIAEKLNIPAYQSLPLPLLTPTAAFPVPILSSLKLGGAFNRLSYQAINFVTSAFNGIVNEWRKTTLGLSGKPRYTTANTPTLYAYSSHVVPTPPDYPAHVHVTGYWFLPSNTGNWTPPQELQAFLAAGEAPVYIGFGSMAGSDPERKAESVLDAVRLSVKRAVIASGWGGLKVKTLPDNVCVIDEAPHDWLFPRVAAVVHHGGSGTTAAGLRAGKPTLITPFMADQPFWGQRVAALGVGADPIPQKELTAERLADGIRRIMTDETLCRNAEALGAKLRAENGTARAVEIVESRG